MGRQAERRWVMAWLYDGDLGPRHNVALMWMLGECSLREAEDALGVQDPGLGDLVDEAALCELGEDLFYAAREAGQV